MLDNKKVDIPDFVKWIDTICYCCGRKFKIRRSYLLRHKTSRFYCSRKCRYDMYKKKVN